MFKKLVLFLYFNLSYSLNLQSNTVQIKTTYNEFIKKMKHRDFSKIYFNPDLSKVFTQDKNDEYVFSTDISPFVTSKIVDTAIATDTDMLFLKNPETPFPLIDPISGFIILTIIFNTVRGFFSRGANNAMNNLFGVNDNISVLKDKLNITLSNWGGSKEVLEECTEIVSYLKNSTIYKNVGAEIPKGVLLEGVPGTGKTLLAKAIATEASASFIAVSGSEFVEMFVGVGAQRIRKLFTEARKNKPCIIFIDEIDAIGRQRGQNGFLSNDEREQTLNQLLTEMDGFNKNDGVIVIAATNRKDILDAALLRPGRFDRLITIPLPDTKSRKDILNVYLKNKKLDKDIDIDTLADLSTGYSGAQLKNLINEAAINAARSGQTIINQKNIQDALEKITIGIIKKIDDRSDEIKKRVAIHESGHALMALTFNSYFNLQKVSIQATYSGAGGYTIFTDKPEISEGGLYTKDILKKRLIIALGGKAAEAVYYGENFISVGATQDLNQANQLALNMIEKFGMGNKLQNFYKQTENIGSPKYSDNTRDDIDIEVAELVNEAYDEAKKIIVANKNKIDRVIFELNKHINLSGYEFSLIVK
jgi:cell division protease FtsH